MTITAKVIADSVSPQGIRLTTLQLRYPKFIHGEFMTHRVFSRNASSSRAIPAERLIKDVMEDPAMPVKWFKNKPGMQGTEEVSIQDGERLGIEWLIGRDYAVRIAKRMVEMNVHKQHVNRIIEPWCHINVVVTATEFSNFFALRDHPDAQPEIRVLAKQMKEAMWSSKPHLFHSGDWHLPYVSDDEWHNILVRAAMISEAARDIGIKVSVARCARVSYLTQEGKKPTIDEDLALYDRLAGSIPLHASPCEHQATPDEVTLHRTAWHKPHLHGNFKGWIQYRKTLAGECQ